MVRQYVDRGTPLQGIQSTVRDARLPYNFARSISNFSLIDGRALRRDGQSVFTPKVVVKQGLLRQTPNEVVTTDVPDQDDQAVSVRTPLSYALLRWHDDYQLKTNEDKTIEFILRLGESDIFVSNNVRRKSLSTYSGGNRVNLEPCSGVKILDQGMLVNEFTYRDSDDTTYSVNRNGVSAVKIDTFNLCTFQVTYDSNGLHVGCAFVDTSRTYKFFSCTNQFPDNTPGSVYRISLVYTASDTTLRVFIDGEEQAQSITVPATYSFAGQEDFINAQTTSNPIKRDIVILNDSIARASYASSAKAIRSAVAPTKQDHNYQSYVRSEEADDIPEYLLLSPPAGTGLTDLRFWSVARTAQDIQVDYNSYVVDTTGLLSYFKLESGLAYDEDTVVPHRYITIHKGEPPVVVDTSMPSGKALLLSDNQYINLEYLKDAYKGVSPSAAALQRAFAHDFDTQMDPRGDFTIQMRIRTPHTFGYEFNKFQGSATLTSTNGDTRDSFEMKAYGLSDGRAWDDDWTADAAIRDENGTAVTTTQQRFHRAYDATLWSIEAQQVVELNSPDNKPDNFRVPLTRGLLTPDGLVAFEFFGVDQISETPAREFRLVSATTLQTNTPYTITFRKRILYFFDSGASPARRIAYGFELAIFLDDSIVPDATLVVGYNLLGAPSVDVTVPNTFAATSLLHGGVREINIGASYVNDTTDRSVSYADTDSTVLERRFVQQRYMSPYQDQPGFFSLGFFRMWNSGISEEDIAAYYASRLPNRSSTLAYDLYIEESGSFVHKDSGPFSEVWTVGYKSWGIPQYQYVSSDKVSNRVGWLNEDRLGYGSVWESVTDLNPPFSAAEGTTACRGLAFYASALGQDYGILGTFAGGVYYSPKASGQFRYQPIPAHGLLTEFNNTSTWRGTSVADRTVLTSYGGRPKTFDGRVLTPLGFKKWSGGGVLVNTVSSALSSTNPVLQQGWYGVRLFYWADKAGIYHVSDQQVVYVSRQGSPGNEIDQIVVQGISAHPDPRVSNLGVAMTIKCDSRELAAVSPVYLTHEGFQNNTYRAEFPLTEANTNILIPTDITEAPQGAFSASYNSRLYIAGDPAIPDIVYFSDPGNVERWDTLTNRLILEDGSGDRIVNIKAMFGSLYVFKPNSIWRVDEIQPGQHQVIKVANIGPIASESIELITIPDTGRVAILFWTRHGPYIFDEVNLQYVGYNIEGEGTPFDWLDPSSVRVTHDIANRSVWFHYRSVGSSYYDGAVIYNYRFNSWTRYTGVVAGRSLSVDLTKQIANVNNDGFEETYLALIGADNGAVYRVGGSVSDGFTPGAEQVVRYRIASVGGNSIGVNTSMNVPENSLYGLWMTIMSQNEERWYSVPITGNTDISVQYDPTYEVQDYFPPEERDYVYIGYVPATIEFPWDMLDVPYFNKQIQSLIIWARGYFFFRLYKDWDLEQYTAWREIPSGGDRRVAVDSIRANSEVFKLMFASFDAGSRLNAYAYLIDYQKEGR